MNFSVTERGVFRRCRRQWDLSSFNRQGLESISTKPALALGSLVHKTLETWLHETGQELVATTPIIRSVDDIAITAPTKEGRKAEDIFLDLAKTEVYRIINDYQERVHVSMSLEEFEQYNKLVALGASMMKNYQARYNSPLPEGFSLIAPEQKVLVPIPNTMHAEVDRETGEVLEVPHHLECTFDGLIRRNHDGAIFILEHKTYEQRPKEEVLKMNDQFLAYTWGANQMNIGRVVGVAYDGMWKRANPPRGRVFDDLFCRVLVMRPWQELEEFENNLRMEVSEMADPNTNIYPNRQWMGCWDCGFEKLCAAMSRGEDVQFMRERFFKKREQPLEAVEELSFG